MLAMTGHPNQHSVWNGLYQLLSVFVIDNYKFENYKSNGLLQKDVNCQTSVVTVKKEDKCIEW